MSQPSIVRDCVLSAEDDGLCFKGAGLRTMENVLVEKLQMLQHVQRAQVRHRLAGWFSQRARAQRGSRFPGCRHAPMLNPKHRHSAISGISWESSDGGTIENVLVTNTRIVHSDTAIFVNIGSRGRVMPGMARPAPGKVRRLLFEHITGRTFGGRGSAIVGAEGDPVEDVAVDDCHLSVGGGGTAQQAASVPKEKPTSYPEAPMYGSMYPAYGFYVWHARDVRFANLAITPQKPDARPCVGAGPDAQNVLLDGQPLGPCPTGGAVRPFLRPAGRFPHDQLDRLTDPSAG